MDSLNLLSVLSRVRNPQGMRRWGFFDHEPDKANPYPARVTQQLMVAGQDYGANNLPPTMFATDNTARLVQPLTGQDWWTRPARRWIPVNVTAFSNYVQVLALVGNPFEVIDVLAPSNKITAQVGDDITLDYGGGVTYRLKIASVQTNAVNAVPLTGGTLPPSRTGVFAQYYMDAYLIELTATRVVPTNEITPTMLTRANLRLIYANTTGTPITQEYYPDQIRSLAGFPRFAATPYTGSRFGVATATSYSQIAELFQIIVARVPDELHLVLDNVWLVSGKVALPAVYHGDMINVSTPVVTNLLTTPGANAVDQQQLPPVDPLDRYTAPGDMIMVAAGSACPPGYENVAQVDSKYNTGFVRHEDGGLVNQAALISFAVSFASNQTTFSANLPKSTPGTHSLAGPQHNSATYELLVITSGQRFSIRIPTVTFTAAGVVSFSLSGDFRYLSTTLGVCQGYLFQSGIIRRTTLSAAGIYQRPTIASVDLQLAQWSYANDPAGQGLSVAGDDGKCWLDHVLVTNVELFKVGDVLTFIAPTGVTATMFLSNLRAVVGYTPPYGPSFRVSVVDVTNGILELTNLDGTPTDVSGYVVANDPISGVPLDTANPPSFKDNSYEITLGAVEHTHLLDVSADQEIKAYNVGGHWVSSVHHAHDVPHQAILPPYTKMVLCARM